MKIICFEIISRHYNDLFIDHFKIEKTRKLIIRKSFLLTFYKNVDTYIKGCNVCLASKIVCNKLYKDF